MKYSLQQQLQIVRICIKENINKTYSELAQICNQLLSPVVSITAQQVRAMLIRFKNFAIARCTKLIHEGQCVKARMYLSWVEELFPTRPRGRRLIH